MESLEYICVFLIRGKDIVETIECKYVNMTGVQIFFYAFMQNIREERRLCANSISLFA